MGAEEQRTCILDTYEPILLQNSDSDPEGMQDVRIISYQTALAGLEALCLFRLQNPHVNSQRGEQVEAQCCPPRPGSRGASYLLTIFVFFEPSDSDLRL